MSIKKIKSFKFLFITILLIFLIILGTVFAPMFFLKNILFKDGYEQFAPDKIYFQTYNPIKPIIYFYRQDGEKEFVVIYAYLTRDGLFSYSGLDLSHFFNNQSLERQNYVSFLIKDITESELKEILKNYDLTRETPEDLNYSRQDFTSEEQISVEQNIEKINDLIAEEVNLPKECRLDLADQKLVTDKTINYSVANISVVTKKTKIIDLKNIFPVNVGEAAGSFVHDSNRVYFNRKIISDPQYPQVKLVQLYFGDMKPDTIIQPEDTLKEIYIVLQDCTRIPVPTKEDGTFDFDNILKKLN